jgi:hypothetical protein
MKKKKKPGLYSSAETIDFIRPVCTGLFHAGPGGFQAKRFAYNLYYVK